MIMRAVEIRSYYLLNHFSHFSHSKKKKKKAELGGIIFSSENTLKIKDFKKSVLFCKYFRNESSDLYIIINFSSKGWNERLKKNHTNICACTFAHEEETFTPLFIFSCVPIFVRCTRMYAKIFTKFILLVHYNHIVKTPTTTSIQLKKTSTAVGFDMIMTLHHPTPPTRQELYLTSGGIIW